MKNYNAIISAVIVGLVAVGAVSAYSGGAPKVLVEGNMTYNEAESFGDAVPPAGNGTQEVYSNDFGRSIMGDDVGVEGTLVSGGDVYNASSSLTVARTLTASEVCDNKVIHVTAGTVANGEYVPASVDITLPATSTLFADCLDDVGDTISFWFHNKSATAATTTQIVAGTGHDLLHAEETGADVEINGGNKALITMTRYEPTAKLEVLTTVEEYIAAD